MGGEGFGIQQGLGLCGSGLGTGLFCEYILLDWVDVCP